MAKWLDTFNSTAPRKAFDKATVEAIFAAHEADELRGVGSLTARELLVNDIIAQHNVVLAQTTGIAPRKPEAAFKDNTVQLNSTQAARAASITKQAMG